MADSYFYKDAHPDRYMLLKVHAKVMRKEMTLAEEYLWNELRAKKLGVTFRRQHPISDYIADFACIAKHLVIEVDGDYHNTEEQKKKDAVRTSDLQRIGYHVIRFTNEEVLNKLPDVLNRIREYL